MNSTGQSATAPDQGDPCGGGEQDGLPSYLWSVLEPTTCELTWHQEELMVFNLGPMTVYNSLQEKLYLPIIIKSPGGVDQART